MGLPVPQVTIVILDGSSSSARRWSTADCRCDSVFSIIDETGPGGILHTASGAGGVSFRRTSYAGQVETGSTWLEFAPSLQPDVTAHINTKASEMTLVLRLTLEVNIFIN
jgi:hypothetical protein